MKEVKILPSILAADMGRLEEGCRKSEAAGADGLHIDIMDGQFVNNISMGIDTVGVVRKAVRIPLSVHLMVVRPDWYAVRCVEQGGDTVLIHVEAGGDTLETLRAIRTAGARAGVVLNPETPASALDGFAADIDEVLCMTVHPGFGGQAFISAVLPKIGEIRRRFPELDISVDGGIDADTAAQSAGQGANIFLVGTTLFRAASMSDEIRRIRQRAAAALAQAVT